MSITGNSTRKSGIIQIGALEQLKLGKNVHGQKLNKYLYNMDAPHNFNLMVSRIWASDSRFYPKFFTRSTVGSASKNYHTIQSSYYQWDAIGDIDRMIRIMVNAEDVTDNTTMIHNGFIGKGGLEFYIVADQEYLSKGSVVQLEVNDYLLIVTNDPVPYGQYFKYTVRLQASDETAGVPLELLMRDRTITDFASSIPDWGVPAKPGLGQLGTGIRFKNVVGKYGREFTVDEPLVRAELRKKNRTVTPMSGLKKMGQNNYYQFSASDFVNGAVFSLPMYTKNPVTGAREVGFEQGVISFLELKVEDMIMLDREAMCKFGKKMDITTTTQGGQVSGTPTKWLVAPGIRELMKDGHVFTHNGNLTAGILQDYLHGIFLTRTEEDSRSVCFVTGELGKLMFHELVDVAAQGYLNSVKGSQFISEDPKGTYANSLQFGYQFTKYIGFNGVEVCLEYDMMLDDPYYCRIKYTNDSKFTVDSARMEIYDFGNTSAVSQDAVSANPNGSMNVSMIIEDMQDTRRWRVGAYHPYNGWLPVSTTDDTTSTYHRTLSGSPVIWDTSRIGYIAYEITEF